MSLAEQVELWVPLDTFALRLIAIRRERDLTQEEAADLCEINPKTWATWELPFVLDKHGNRKPAPKPRDMAAVAAAIERGLGAERDWVMWGDRLPRSRCFSASALVSAVPPMMGQVALFDLDTPSSPFVPVLVSSDA